MQIIRHVREMQALMDGIRKEGKTIGFVPTMGFLHDGHLSLIHAARQTCDVVVSSIFVNPMQFGPGEDLDRYPRDEQGDTKKCEDAGVDFLFMPDAGEMYPEKASVFVVVEGVSSVLEGAIRPGHFRGVATVVAKLFNIVKPQKAFFGQKDFQQCVVIERMVHGLNMDVDIIVLPTVREADGLAMSSRNSYLTAEERRAAAVISRALSAAQKLIAAGVKEPGKVKNKIFAVLREEKGLTVDYVEMVDSKSLAPLDEVRGQSVVLVAVRIGKTRLIDNLLLP